MGNESLGKGRTEGIPLCKQLTIVLDLKQGEESIHTGKAPGAVTKP
jgi:hypothetical protein